jgi:RNA polymerase sigma factor (sigma-70 family)
MRPPRHGNSRRTSWPRSPQPDRTVNPIAAIGQYVVMETSSTPLTDGELIAASLDQPERFAPLFDRHHGRVHRYLERRSGRRVAEDLAAETFVVAFGRRAVFDTRRADARPWLYGIAANLLRSEWREERRQLAAWERSAIRDESDLDADGVAERVDAQAMTAVVAVGLAELDGRDRETLTLMVWAELSYEEIAEALAIPTGTVRSRIHRARIQMRAVLAEHGIRSVTVVEGMHR